MRQQSLAMLRTLSRRFWAGRSGTGFRTLTREEGTGLVEYALVLLLFMTMILGIIDFSRLLYAYHFVSNTAREATRYASVRGSTCNDDGPSTPGSCSLSTPDSGPAAPGNTVIQDYVNTLAVPAGINTSSTGCNGSPCLTTTPNWPVQTAGPTICGAAVAGVGPTPNAPGCTVKVKVSYTFSFIFPLVYKPFAPNGTITLSSTSEMIIVH